MKKVKQGRMSDEIRILVTVRLPRWVWTTMAGAGGSALVLYLSSR